MADETTIVSDIMTTAVIAVTPDETIDAADAEMKMAAIRHLLVLDERRHLIGIISDRDLLRAIGKRGAQGLPVREIMSTDVQTVGESAPAYEASSVMLQHKISALPVVGEEGQVVGIVSESDFMRIAHEAIGGEPWGY